MTNEVDWRPTKLGELLEIAVHDARKFDALVQQQPCLYEWNMAIFRDIVGWKCSGCVYGAVMHFRDWKEYGDDAEYADAVDYMRTGLFYEAWDRLNPKADGPEDYDAERRCTEVKDLWTRLYGSNIDVVKPPSGTLMWDQFDVIIAKLKDLGL